MRLFYLAAFTLDLGLVPGGVWSNCRHGENERRAGPRVLTVRRPVWRDSLCVCHTQLGSRASGTPAVACLP